MGPAIAAEAWTGGGLCAPPRVRSVTRVQILPHRVTQLPQVVSDHEASALRRRYAGRLNFALHRPKSIAEGALAACGRRRGAWRSRFGPRSPPGSQRGNRAVRGVRGAPALTRLRWAAARTSRGSRGARERGLGTGASRQRAPCIRLRPGAGGALLGRRGNVLGSDLAPLLSVGNGFGGGSPPLGWRRAGWEGQHSGRLSHHPPSLSVVH